MVSASDFFAVQKNIEYRKVWDKLVISIDVVDDNNNVKSESVVEQVLRWITAFPVSLFVYFNYLLIIYFIFKLLKVKQINKLLNKYLYSQLLFMFVIFLI